MTIRKAEKRDIPKILDLLSQVLEIHANIRPDVFVSGSTKYTEEQLVEIIETESETIFVATDTEDNVVGYVFCKFRGPSKSNNLKPYTSIMIDDLCVDESQRGNGVGTELFEFVKGIAKKIDCHEIILAVWEGNDAARAFYDKLGMRPKETIMEYVLD
ncbi:MAG: GNAT family N-acetyltransferase [Clostridia bacterium]|nr:GNAT family N-acetyltransferase [Clostridia bacterium]